MSLVGSAVEKKDNYAGEPDAKNGTTPTELCSACGKESDALKKCRSCKCVWYCDKECQNKHWKEHKHECKPIKEVLDARGGKLDVGTEKEVGPLGKLPPQEECPICMRVMPIHTMLRTYAACCSKFICGGCKFQHTRKSERPTCAFCRTKPPESDEEILTRLRKKVELKDPNALYQIATFFGYGRHGLPIDQAKCIDLLRQSADLGFPDALFLLANFHHNGMMGLEQNKEEALKCQEKAAEGGHLPSLYNVACEEVRSGNDVAAIRHLKMAASGGYKNSMGGLIAFFEDGLLRHGDLAESVQAFYLARGEMKSEDRDQYIQHLKMTGEYDTEYDC